MCFAFFLSGDVARVNGQLAVSRAFGDKNLKSHLRSDPDIQHADIDPDTEFIILASDGLWKVWPTSPYLSPFPSLQMQVLDDDDSTIFKSLLVFFL